MTSWGVHNVSEKVYNCPNKSIMYKTIFVLVYIHKLQAYINIQEIIAIIYP